MYAKSLQPLRGFTLIELLVVIAIIGILAGIVLASLTAARDNAQDAKRVSELQQISRALEMYANANGGYPTDGTNTTVAEIAGLLVPAYMSTLPHDPTKTGAWDYRYCSNTPRSYVLLANMTNTSANGNFCYVSASPANDCGWTAGFSRC